MLENVVRFPPDNPSDFVGWTKALLSDLAGQSWCANELLQAVWDVAAGRLVEWSMNYNVYGVQLSRVEATITFLDDSCPVPLDVLESALVKHIGL